MLPIHLPGVIRTVEDARAALGSAGKIMVRYSGTENKLRVLVEARSRELAEKWHGHICSAVRKAVEK